MTAHELIQKYAICYDGPDSIAVHATVTETDISLIQLAKPQILAVLRERHETQQIQGRRHYQVLSSIPGVEEYRACLRGEYDGGLNALEASLGDADYMAAQSVVQVCALRHSENRELAFVASKAYDAFCRGEDPHVVAHRYSRDMAAFYSRAVWGD